MFSCIAGAYFIDKRSVDHDTVAIGIKNDVISGAIYLLILVAIILFSGTRSGYNDTYTYKENFEFLLKVDQISFSTIFTPYGGFQFYQMLIKKYISTNPQALVFITAVLTNILILPYIIRHTKYFASSLFFFFINFFSFSMAGLKQAIAMAIALYALDAFMRKKYCRAAIIFFVAYTFHPYIICLLSVILLTESIWNTRTVVIIIIIVFVIANFENFLGFFTSIGKEYEATSFLGQTINPFRIIVESIPIIISWIYRKKINETNDKWLILGINLSIVSFFILVLGLFFNAMYLGRIATYFSIISFIALPKMLHAVFDGEERSQILFLAYYSLFFVYCVLDMTKLLTYDLFYDPFLHVSLSQVF